MNAKEGSVLGMIRTLGLGSFLLWGCAQAEQVSVGGFDRAFELGACSGVYTDCDDPLPEAAVFEPHAPLPCEASDDKPWEIAWARSIEEPRCEPYSSCYVVAVSFAPDGTVWTASVATEEPGGEDVVVGLFLAHYDANGETLAEKLVDTAMLEKDIDDVHGWSLFGWSFHQVAIAADARGHLFAAVALNGQKRDSDERTTSAWIAEYDSDAARVSDRIALKGLDASTSLSLKFDAGARCTCSPTTWRRPVRATRASWPSSTRR